MKMSSLLFMRQFQKSNKQERGSGHLSLNLKASVRNNAYIITRRNMIEVVMTKEGKADFDDQIKYAISIAEVKSELREYLGYMSQVRGWKCGEYFYAKYLFDDGEYRIYLRKAECSVGLSKFDIIGLVNSAYIDEEMDESYMIALWLNTKIDDASAKGDWVLEIRNIYRQRRKLMMGKTGLKNK